MATDPLRNLPDNDRYSETRDLSKGDCGHYCYQAVTLEDEAEAGGWLPNNTPTGPNPIDLYTVGMRGEPGYDDDPKFDSQGQISHNGHTASADISDVD